MDCAAAPEYDSTRVRTTIASEVRELYRYRDFLKLLVARTTKSRYKRSALGVAWTLLNPLVRRQCHRVAWLDHGRLRGYGPAGEVVAAYLQVSAG